MKKNKFTAIALLAVMALSVGCSDGTTVSNTSSSSTSQSSGEALPLEGIAQNEITANISEDAAANDTVFRLNRVINSGKTDDSGNPYIYLDVNISNATGTEYELSVLNNFYVLLADKSEVHFDIKTQLYAANNIENYSASPFAVPANSDFSGIIGGFIIPKDAQDFTVCFFPTKENKSDKANVVKVSVSAQNMVTLN